MQITFTSEQHKAIEQVKAWLDPEDKRRVFRLFGPAGTGKTTLARVIGENRDVRYVAPTGKAAYRLAQLGCSPSSTIHALLYVPTGGEREDGDVEFAMRKDLSDLSYDLIIADEASMISPDVAIDLQRATRKLLLLGDPYQLPPINVDSVYTMTEPEVLLTQVHRQAAQSPIIMAATHVRSGAAGPLPTGANDVGRCDVIPGHKQLPAAAYVDQVLVGRNSTRVRVNEMIRGNLGLSGSTPAVGEKLVCVRNNPTSGVYNGSTWRVVTAGRPSVSGRLELSVTPADVPGDTIKVVTHTDVLSERVRPNQFPLDKQYSLFQFGYAITVHKAQGSQWDKVLLYNEASIFREAARNWLYTGITRAAKELYVV